MIGRERERENRAMMSSFHLSEDGLRQEESVTDERETEIGSARRKGRAESDKEKEREREREREHAARSQAPSNCPKTALHTHTHTHRPWMVKDTRERERRR